MYVTFKKEFIEQQYTFDDLFDSLYAGTTELLTNTEPHTTYHTTTLSLPMRHITPRIRTELEKMEHVLDTIMQKVTDITQEDMSEHYTTFQIPKRSGGLRRIDAPKQELMSLLSEIKDIFHYKLGALAHEQAYAYIQGRSCKMALEQHQKNASKYFAKYDVKDFFSRLYKRIYYTPVTTNISLLSPHTTLRQNTKDYRHLFTQQRITTRNTDVTTFNKHHNDTV